MNRLRNPKSSSREKDIEENNIGRDKSHLDKYLVRGRRVVRKILMNVFQ